MSDSITVTDAPSVNTVTVIRNLDIAYVNSNQDSSVPVVSTRDTVSIKDVGIQGPPGPSESFIHVQSSPSSVWTVNHNLGFNPSVSVFSVGGMEIMAEVIHISINQFQVLFSVAQAGTCRSI